MKIFMGQIEEAALCLQSGGLIAFPTETVYGLGAVISSEDAVNQIYTVKGRPADNPLIAHIADVSQLDLITIGRPTWLDGVLDKFWPGPLSVVLPHGGKAPAWTTAGLDTIAVRCPRHPVASELLRRVGEPVVAPSANLSGKPSPTTAAHVLEDFADDHRIAMVLDGGPCEVGLESTVLLALPDQGIVLRAGHITPTEISQVAGVLVTYDMHSPDRPQSPGQKYRHYAPAAEVVLRSRESLRGDEELVLALDPAPGEEYLTGQTLYGSLRAADQRAVKRVTIVSDGLVPDSALWERLQKITAHAGLWILG